MNNSQMSLHVARHAADRLATELDPDLPTGVTDALSGEDLGGAEVGFDPPPVHDTASFVAACAVRGVQALVHHRAPGRKPDELRADLRRSIEKEMPRPAGLDETVYGRVVEVITDELVSASHRHDMHA